MNVFRIPEPLHPFKAGATSQNGGVLASGSMPAQSELLHSLEYCRHLGHHHSAICGTPGNKPAIGAEFGGGWPPKPRPKSLRPLRSVPAPYPDTDNGVAIIPQSIRQPRSSTAERAYSAFRVTCELAARDFEEVRPFARSAATGEHPPSGIQAKAFAITLDWIRQRQQLLTGLRVDHLQDMVLEVCHKLRSAHCQNLAIA